MRNGLRRPGGAVVVLLAVLAGCGSQPAGPAAAPQQRLLSTSTALAPATEFPAGTQGDFTPLPGVPQGDAAVGDRLPPKETARRCRLRYPDFDGHLTASFNRPGFSDMMATTHGWCTVPGGHRPSGALIEAAAKDPLPADPAGQLRNCSVLMWHDLTKWKVVATGRVQNYRAEVVALSPKGDKAALCALGEGSEEQSGIWRSSILFVNTTIRMGQTGDQTCSAGRANGACLGWVTYDSGHVDKSVAKLVLRSTRGKTHEVPVHDGWYAFVWAEGSKPGAAGITATAYDKSGKEVKYHHNGTIKR
ncbi:hypothetical protein [Kribbella deserti]|uniref:Lipoprotein n=1 Tax=Kribbella deserti TaxID=1926257 RepID=A0ABV6QR94_9ACTN